MASAERNHKVKRRFSMDDVARAAKDAGIDEAKIQSMLSQAKEEDPEEKDTDSDMDDDKWADGVPKQHGSIPLSKLLVAKTSMEWQSC